MNLTSVLAAWGLQDATLLALPESDNRNFRVDAPQGTCHLRHHNKTRKRAEIDSEWLWLATLRQAGFAVPTPIPTKHNQTLLEQDDGIFVLCHWIDGTVQPELNTTQAEDAGRIMAGMHQLASQWVVPPGFVRRSYNHAFFASLLKTIQHHIPAQDLALCERVLDKALAMLVATPTTPDLYGLIHADCHGGNYIANGEGLTLIDFDRLGFGHFAYDIATAQSYLGDTAQESFLRGYQSLQALPTGFETQRPGFLMLAFLESLAFLAPKPVEQEHVQEQFLPYLRKTFVAYLAG